MKKGYKRKYLSEDIKQELEELEQKEALDEQDFRSEDIERALYCHHYGPCEVCQQNEEEPK